MPFVMKSSHYVYFYLFVLCFIKPSVVLSTVCGDEDSAGEQITVRGAPRLCFSSCCMHRSSSRRCIPPDQLKSLTPPRARMNSITDVCSATMMRRVRRTEVVVVPLLGKEMTAPTLSPLALEATSVTMAAIALILDVLACQAESDTHAGSANPLYEARQYSATSHTRQVNRSLYVAPHVFVSPRAVCTVRLLEGASHPDQLKSLTPPRARMNSITDVCSATMMRRVRRTEVVVVPLLGKEMTAPTLSPLALEATSVTMAASALILDVLACQAESDTRADLVLMNNSKSPMAMKIRTGRSRALQSQSPYCFLRCWLGCFSWFEENVRASPCFHHFKFTQKNRLLIKCDSRMRVYLRGSLRFVIPTIHSKHRLTRLLRRELPRTRTPRRRPQPREPLGERRPRALRRGRGCLRGRRVCARKTFRVPPGDVDRG